VAVRRRQPFVDHVVRAYGRYTNDGGDRLAASVTYFAFLSFFPLVALAFSITGFVVDAYPDLQDELTSKINDYLPGLADKLDVGSIGGAKVGVGLLGLLGLVLAGLAWIDAMRDAIRLMWHQNIDVGNVVTRRVKDLGVLAGLGLMLLASTVVTSLATSATGWFLDWVGLSGSTVAKWFTGALALALALAIDLIVFLYLFWRLAGTTIMKRRVLRGALLGAVGVELLKIAGTWLIARTTTNPVYGTFAVIVGLLIWINIVMRWTLFVSAWTVTAPYSSDVLPSGTAEHAVTGDDDVGTSSMDGSRADPAVRADPVVSGRSGREESARS
jgi:membrane protein